MSNQKEENSIVKHPNHYNVYDVEVLDMMAAIWGNEAVALWCKLTAFKYRMRIGYKAGVDPNIDFKKEQECLELMHKYQSKVESDQCHHNNSSGKLFELDNVSHTKVDEFDLSYPVEAQYNP